MPSVIFDYFRCTIIPIREIIGNISVSACVEVLGGVFHFEEYLEKFQIVGKAPHYAAVYRFNDISIKIPTEERLYTQGICLECTSNGLAHLVCSLPKDCDFRSCCRDFRALSLCGFKCNLPRLDVALDDIAKGDNKPILHMNTIYKKWRKHEFCSRSQASTEELPQDFGNSSAAADFFKTGRVSTNLKKGYMGRTIYFGSRKSAVYVRFYDKLAEKRQKGVTVADDINSWIRCEYEFHGVKAMSVLNLYIDNKFSDFVSLYKKVVLGHLRFIQPTDSNRARCATSSWWTAFLDSIEGAALANVPPKSVNFKRSCDWFMYACAPTLWAILTCTGTTDFITELKEQGRKNITGRQLQLIEDFYNTNNSLVNECENIWALLMAVYDYSDYEAAMKKLKEDALYIKSLPISFDRRQWLNMVFADCKGVTA